VQGTEGAEFVEGLEVDKVHHVITKGEDKELESYSAFADVWGLKQSGLLDALKGTETVFIVGLGAMT
jgi:nicotinamidase-related amidase